jgi:hypothetical protein
MTPPNGPQPPLPDGRGGWIHDTPRPTSPPPPRRRPRVPIDSDNSLARAGLRALRRAVQDFRAAGLSDADIEQIFRAEIKPSWDEANE